MIPVVEYFRQTLGIRKSQGEKRLPGKPGQKINQKGKKNVNQRNTLCILGIGLYSVEKF